MATAASHRPVGVVVLRERRAEHRHHRVADVLHDRALLLEDGGVHLRPVLVELAGQHRGVGALGDAGVAADVGHQHGDLELARSRRSARRSSRSFSASAAGQEAAQRLALLLAVDDRLLEQPEPAQRAVVAGARALGQHRNSCSIASFTASGVVSVRRAIALIGRPSAMVKEQLLGRRSARRRRSPATPAPRRSPGRASSRRWRPRGWRRPAGCRRPRGPSAGRRSRRRRRPGARWRTRGRRTGDRITMPVPGWRLRISLAASMPSSLEGRRHADVGHDHLRLRLGRRRRAARRSRRRRRRPRGRARIASRARTPSRTSRLSSARNTVMVRAASPDAPELERLLTTLLDPVGTVIAKERPTGPVRVAAPPRSTRSPPRSTRSVIPYGRRPEGSTGGAKDVELVLCGVRGSTAAPGAAYVRTGGHTSCVAIRCP